MDFTDRCSSLFALDAHKRVHYTHGLVLGVGELRSEQHYFLSKHRGHNRRLHGYGTVGGLAVTVRDTVNGPEVRVAPGFAIDAHGHDICVAEPQCARLNDWLLQRQQATGSPPLDSSPPAAITAYVVLCYHECETDRVPIPVGPCHSLDKSTVASRIQDSFELRILESPPPQIEETAIRLLGDLLSRVTIASGGLTTPDALLDEVRALATAGSPPQPPLSPPPDITLDPQFAEEILRAALRVFVTEVRPLLVPEGGGCLEGPRDETCVLLAQISFDVDEPAPGVLQVAGPVTIDETERPFLLQTRVLQEFWLGGGGLGPMMPFMGGGFGGGFGGPILPLISGFGGPPGAPTDLLSLSPSLATPVSGVTAGLFESLPALLFTRDGVATFTFSLPPNITPGSQLSLRLHWAFERQRGAAPPLSWRATLRLVGGDEALTDGRTGQAVFNVEGDADARGRLLITAPVSLGLAAPAVPAFASLSVTLQSERVLPANTTVSLLMAELGYSAWR